MSGVIFEETNELATQAALRACWTQWVALGSLLAPVESRRARSIIDLEALVLLSLHIQTEERRLLDTVAWWAHVGSRLTSLQRLRSVAKQFPGETDAEGLEQFAGFAMEAGDRRWAKLAESRTMSRPRDLKGPEEPILIEASALWPRLRAAFGVGAKADTLVFLLGLRGAWASTKVISFATGYSSVTIRRAAGEMAQARLIRETEGRPVEYVAPPQPWAELLELYPNPDRWDAPSEPAAPAWRFWSEIFAFLAGAIEWSRSGGSMGEHVIASKARDLIERHAQAFNFNGIQAPPVEAFRGLDAARGLRETVFVVSDWLADAV